MISRRTFLTSSSLAAIAALEAHAVWARALPPAARPPIGVQLYMLRTAFAADPAATLRRVRSLEFRTVEWWSALGDRPAREWRTMLDDAGLVCRSAHIDPADLGPQTVDRLLDWAETMGVRWLLVAWMPQRLREKPEDWQRLADVLNGAGERAARRGMRTGYHNHDFEFARLGDSTPLDILLRRTDPRLVDFELDCYWAAKAGQDPVALLRRHRGRFTQLHLKDAGPAPTYQMHDVGAGVLPWRRLLHTAVEQGVQQAYVEHDTPTEMWASAAASRRYLRTLGY